MHKSIREKGDRLNALLEEGRIKEKKEHDAYMRQHDSILEEMRASVKKAQELLRWKVRQAKVWDYKEWLAGYLEKGKKPTHYYNYPMKRSLDEWRVALHDFEIVPLFGANALCIIVAKGVKCKGGELGHSHLYFMDDFSQVGDFVPVYSDIAF